MSLKLMKANLNRRETSINRFLNLENSEFEKDNDWSKTPIIEFFSLF